MSSEQISFTVLGQTYDIFLQTTGTSGTGTIVAIAGTAAGGQAITGLDTTFPTAVPPDNLLLGTAPYFDVNGLSFDTA
jgi:hypothetical protein